MCPYEESRPFRFYSTRIGSHRRGGVQATVRPSLPRFRSALGQLGLHPSASHISPSEIARSRCSRLLERRKFGDIARYRHVAKAGKLQARFSARLRREKPLDSKGPTDGAKILDSETFRRTESPRLRERADRPFIADDDHSLRWVLRVLLHERREPNHRCPRFAMNWLHWTPASNTPRTGQAIIAPVACLLALERVTCRAHVAEVADAMISRIVSATG